MSFDNNFGSFNGLYSNWVIIIFIFNNQLIMAILIVYIVIEYINFYFK